MVVTLVIALIGAAAGIWSLVWQIRTKRQERARVVVRSWWERHVDLERVFVIEAHNAGTKDAVELVKVGAEKFFPGGLGMTLEGAVAERWYSWWLGDIGLADQEGWLTGSAAEAVTLAAQHRVTYRFDTAVVGDATDSFFPVVKLATGEVVRGDEVLTKPDPATIRNPWNEPTE